MSKLLRTKLRCDIMCSGTLIPPPTSGPSRAPSRKCFSYNRRVEIPVATLRRRRRWGAGSRKAVMHVPAESKFDAASPDRAGKPAFPGARRRGPGEARQPRAEETSLEVFSAGEKRGIPFTRVIGGSPSVAAQPHFHRRISNLGSGLTFLSTASAPAPTSSTYHLKYAPNPLWTWMHPGIELSGNQVRVYQDPTFFRGISALRSNVRISTLKKLKRLLQRHFQELTRSFQGVQVCTYDAYFQFSASESTFLKATNDRV